MTRRVYDHGGTGNTYTSKVTIDRALGSSLATVKTYDAQNVLLARTDHYYYGDPSYVPSSPTVYPGWGNNREYKTDYFATNGTTLLRSLSYTWQPRVTYSWTAADPRLVETVTTLTDTNQVSKQTFGYDDTVPYNNQNNVKEYDFGSGTPGPLLRETRTTYVTAANYTGTSVHLRSLPTQVSIYNALNTLVAQTVLEYDNYG